VNACRRKSRWSRLFSISAGIERHNYQQMPLYPLIEAGVFKAFGVGVLQMRALPVAFGFFLLLVVFAVGREAADERVAALAVVLMVVLRVAAIDGATGIVLLDRARINRYDIAVPVFGFLALLAFNRAERQRAAAWYFAAGALVGLASLSHLYGVFWLPIFAAIAFARRGWGSVRESSVWLVFAGFTCSWIPWGIFVASGWADYRGQMLADAPRFDLLNPSFYTSNLLHATGPISVRWLWESMRAAPLWRVGTWAAFFGVPSALIVMAARSRARKNDPLFALALATVAQVAMFALLLNVKTYDYMIALWPFGALCLAWLGIWLWDWRRTLAPRVALALLGGLIVAQGCVAVVRAHEEALHTTPYDFYEAQVARCIPPGSRVLGLQHYWLGLRQYPFRTWLLPIGLSTPRFTDHPISFEDALDVIHPDVILVDHYIAEMFGEAASPTHRNHPYYTGFEDFKAHRHVEPACVIHDPTYGPMEVYLVPPREPGK
jgi:hypothetical protein